MMVEDLTISSANTRRTDVATDTCLDETYNRHEDYIFWLTILKEE